MYIQCTLHIDLIIQALRWPSSTHYFSIFTVSITHLNPKIASFPCNYRPGYSTCLLKLKWCNDILQVSTLTNNSREVLSPDCLPHIWMSLMNSFSSHLLVVQRSIDYELFTNKRKKKTFTSVNIIAVCKIKCYCTFFFFCDINWKNVLFNL